MQDTTLCSHLASVGFIVLSIGHPYESSAVKYLNGNIIKIHDDNYMHLKQTREYNKYLKSIYNSTKEYSDRLKTPSFNRTKRFFMYIYLK